VSEQEYPDHWLENIVQQILERKTKKIALSTGKTPSGHIHLGILRELLICDALNKILKKRNYDVTYRLFFDSLDAAKRFPPYIPKDYATEHIGSPFALIPNPFESDNRSYAQVFGDELIDTFNELGIDVNVVWTNELYKTDEMKDMIRIGLKKNEEVKKIVAKYLTASMTDEKKETYLKQQETWMGAMVICEKCQSTQKKKKNGTIHPNRVIKYDETSDTVEYICPACSHKGEVKISSGLVKLNWRLDWPAKWTIFQTTCEPAGKDHCTPGGSYDTGLDLSRSIYGYEGPVKVPYEWLRLGDRDMGTSKGVVFTPSKFLSLAEGEIIRMIIYQTNPNKHISFRIEELEQYYNEFERLEKIYYGIEKASTEQEEKEIKYIFPLIYTKNLPEKCPERFPFKMLTTLSQLEPILGNEGIYNRAVEYMKKENFSHIIDNAVFEKLIRKASNWITEMKEVLKNEKNPQIIKQLKKKVIIFSIPKNIDKTIIETLSEDHIKALQNAHKRIESITTFSEEKIKEMMMGIRDDLKIKPKILFQSLYYVMFGEKQGPRLGPIMAMLGKDWLELRLKLALYP
jgi:lysyl-tRNA synthetase, class I